MAFDLLIKKNATVDDTLQLIVKAINHCKDTAFVKNLAHALGPVTDKQQFIKRLFDYICSKARYKLDIPGIEEVWTPEKVIREGVYDCKKISVLISSVLQAAGIDSVLKHVYYAGPDGSLKDYTHIYVIVPNPDLQNYITVDPTNDCQYDTEVSSSKQTLYFLDGRPKMELHYMGKPDSNGTANKGGRYASSWVNPSGYRSQLNMLAGSMENDLASIAGCNTTVTWDAHFPYLPHSTTKCRSDRGNFDYTIWEEGQHYQNMINLYPARAAVLTIIGLGNKLVKSTLKMNLAWRTLAMWNQNPSGFHKLWWQLGGSDDAAEMLAACVQGIGTKDFSQYFKNAGKKFPPIINGIGRTMAPPGNPSYESLVAQFRNTSIPTFNGGPEQPLDRPYFIPQGTVDVINREFSSVDGIGYVIGMSDAVIAALIAAAIAIITALMNFYSKNQNSDPNLRGDGPPPSGTLVLTQGGTTPLTVNGSTYNIPNDVINSGVNAIQNYAQQHNIPIPPIHVNTPINSTPPAAPGTPAAGSFATHSIDNVHDLLNFLKVAGILMFGASLHPALIIPTAIIVTASFLYAIKNKLRFA